MPSHENTPGPDAAALSPASPGSPTAVVALVAASYVVMLAVNAAAVLLPLNGKNTAEIAAVYPVLFQPAGWVFSIWSVIYVLTGAYVVYQARSPQFKGTGEPADSATYDNPRIAATRWLFIVSSLLNAAWLVLWHYEQFLLSVVVMAALLVTLIAIYRRLDVGRRQVSAGERWCAHLTFSVYLGWISVATIANVAVGLVSLGWNGEPASPAFWTVLLLIVAAVLGGLMLRLRRDAAYVAVLVWAFLGIAARDSDVRSVAVTSLVLALALALAGILTLRRGTLAA